MPKQKSAAIVLVPDGAGGMRQADDLRFEGGEWPIELIIPPKDAETWMAHLGAEREDRGWGYSGLSQLDSAENSGTLLMTTASGPSSPTLQIVWDKLRNESLRVRARPGGGPVLSLDIARGFLDATIARQRAGTTLRLPGRMLLAYNGLPWRGELWLDQDHRLGPPSKHPNTLLGPQIVILDAMVEGIGQQGVSAMFQARIRELQVFLGFVLGIVTQQSRLEHGWVCDIGSDGLIADCAIKPVGYGETYSPCSSMTTSETHPSTRCLTRCTLR